MMMDAARRGLLKLAAAVGLVGLPGCAQANPRPDLLGDWAGVLGEEPTGLRLRLALGPGGSAQLFSLDQGGEPIPASWRAVGERIIVDVPAVKGRFEGVIGTDRLEGDWRQPGGGGPLVLVRGAEAGLERGPAKPLDAAMLAALRTQAVAPAMAAVWCARGATPTVLTDGVRSVGSDTPVGPDERWHLGSITKSMTATLAAICVEAGEIGWDTPLQAVLGDKLAKMRPAYGAATLMHLLSHRAGVVANIGLFDTPQFDRTPADPVADRLAYADIALAKAPVTALGASQTYSNAGYTVAAAMLEARSGKPWEVLMRERLFEPLGMTTAGFGAPDPAANPVGHLRRGQGLRPMPPTGSDLSDNVPAIGPAGRVHLSLADLARYLRAHADRASLLKPGSWDRLHAPAFGDDYALGWVVRPDGTRWHNGSNTMWYAEAAFDPVSGNVAAACCNSGDLRAVGRPVAQALAGALVAA
jgi:CubicO group peptidase (beta-lactamase class C family)